jgi:hypothetical protein
VGELLPLTNGPAAMSVSARVRPVRPTKVYLAAGVRTEVKRAVGCPYGIECITSLHHSILSATLRSQTRMLGFNELPVVESTLDLRGNQFKLNLESWQPIIEKFEAASKYVTSEATSSSLLKHQSRGQLLGVFALPQSNSDEQIGLTLRSSRSNIFAFG